MCIFNNKERFTVEETFLRGDKLESYLPMGENGQAVHLSALQLRETLRLRQLSEVANSLAIPQVNEQGDRIDWYASFSGNVVPWAAATDDERQAALKQLEANKVAIEQLSAQMLSQKTHEMRLFGALLSKTIQFPDKDHVYLVDGKPVLTFWGFVNAQQQARPNPFDCLKLNRPAPSNTGKSTDIPPVPTTLTKPSVKIEEVISISRSAGKQTRRWVIPRWLWWVLPILLLFILLMLLRGCVPNWYFWGVSPSTHLVSELPMQEEKNLQDGKRILLPPEIAVSPPETNTIDSMNPTFPTQSNVPTTPTVGMNSTSGKVSIPSPLSTAANIPPVLLTVPSVDALVIPDNAVQKGTVDFLNGRWYAGAGIQDIRTGKPLRLMYQVTDGKGFVEMVRGDGIRCQAPVTAAMESGSLKLDNHDEAKCSDGSTYTMPEVICQSDSQGVTACTGRYNEKTLFPMSIKREAD
ncbi:hypothetical protein J8V57_10660 [Xenorhabdus sp. PB61.4]|nr:SrfA family protein [Xenorhabdus sp. PB61.4]MCC8366743.1 hypothetical protein [Xenorhabdus sp. PB61.4]